MLLCCFMGEANKFKPHRGKWPSWPWEWSWNTLSNNNLESWDSHNWLCFFYDVLHLWWKGLMWIMFFGSIIAIRKSWILSKKMDQNTNYNTDYPNNRKANLQSGIPMIVFGAISTEQSSPRMEPMFPVSCSHPKAIPRLLSSVESATRDWIAGMTMASPIPFKLLETAT